MSKMGGNKFDQRFPSNTMGRKTDIKIGGPMQRTADRLGPAKPIKGMSSSTVRTNQAALNQMLKSPVTTKEKITAKVSGVKSTLTSAKNTVADKLKLSNPMDRAMRAQAKIQKKTGK
jgi:hypothetical protein